MFITLLRIHTHTQTRARPNTYHKTRRTAHSREVHGRSTREMTNGLHDDIKHHIFLYKLLYHTTHTLTLIHSVPVHSCVSVCSVCCTLTIPPPTTGTSQSGIRRREWAMFRMGYFYDCSVRARRVVVVSYRIERIAYTGSQWLVRRRHPPFALPRPL